MSELKTKKTIIVVDEFINEINELQREDSREIIKIMSDATKAEAKIWGTTIVGFGDKKLKYESGRELDWFKIGFSPRKQTFTLYGLRKVVTENPTLLKNLGKYKEGKGCIYIKRLSDINLDILKEIIYKSV